MVHKSEVFDDKLGSTNNTIFVTICQQSTLLYAWLHVCYLSNDQDFNKKHPYILRTFILFGTYTVRSSIREGVGLKPNYPFGVILQEIPSMPSIWGKIWKDLRPPSIWGRFYHVRGGPQIC